MRSGSFLLTAMALSIGCRNSPDELEAVKRRIRSEFPDVDRVSTDELKRALDDGEELLLLDVREEEEFAVSRLRGAFRAEPGTAGPDLLDRLDRDAAIVTYCAVGYRSAEMAARLKQQGFTNVRNLEGSIFEWANKGYPVERNGEPVREVHPYDEEWGRLLDPPLRAYRPGGTVER